MEPFAPPAAWFCCPSVPHSRVPLRKGLGKVAFKWFSIKLLITINKFHPTRASLAPTSPLHHNNDVRTRRAEQVTPGYGGRHGAISAAGGVEPCRARGADDAHRRDGREGPAQHALDGPRGLPGVLAARSREY